MNKQEFTSNGTFTVPAGVTRLFVLGCAGGDGGPSGSTNGFSTPSLNERSVTNLLSMKMIDVTPNTTYTVTLGAGGTGGAASNTIDFNTGSPGGNTSFGTTLWYGASSGNPGASDSCCTIILGGVSTHNSNAQYASGSDGSSSGGYIGGCGSPGTSFAAGVSGGNANSGGAGTAGSNATSYGGCGAGGGCGSTSGGAGGNGYKGYILVLWVD
jgi:hypothetical protein